MKLSANSVELDFLFLWTRRTVVRITHTLILTSLGASLTTKSMLFMKAVIVGIRAHCSVLVVYPIIICRLIT